MSPGPLLHNWHVSPLDARQSRKRRALVERRRMSWQTVHRARNPAGLSSILERRRRGIRRLRAQVRSIGQREPHAFSARFVRSHTKSRFVFGAAELACTKTLSTDDTMKSDELLPDGRITRHDDGTVSIRFTPEELEQLASEDPDDDAVAAAPAGRKDYCCRCSESGDRHTIRASWRGSAILKCAAKCGGGFSVSSGSC